MSTLSAEMAFEIGELVYMKESTYSSTQSPNTFMIVERCVQECHGGVQRMYRVSGQTALLPEIMLSREMPPYRTYRERDADNATRIWGTSLASKD